MNIRQIVERWLRTNEYDGLCSDDCGCEVDDLMPCDNYEPYCEPGYKVPCPEPEGCPADGDCPWHINPIKPEKKAANGKDGQG